MAQVIRPGRAGPVRRRAGDVPHEDRELADGRRSRRSQLDAAYVAVAKSLGLPTQSYMALSDAPDPRRAGRRRDVRAARCSRRWPGVNSRRGPGMLDFLLVFSLPKLVFDDEMCGQALRFVREVEVARRPAGARAWCDQLMADQHLIMADHTMTPLAERAVPDRPDRRPRQPRELDAGGRQGHLRAGLRRGRAPARRLPPARDRPGDRRRAAADHPRPAWSTRSSCRRSRSRRSRSAAAAQAAASGAATPAASGLPAAATDEPVVKEVNRV